MRRASGFTSTTVSVLISLANWSKSPSVFGVSRLATAGFIHEKFVLEVDVDWGWDAAAHVKFLRLGRSLACGSSPLPTVVGASLLNSDEIAAKSPVKLKHDGDLLAESLAV
jgi:hypothetical protein